MLFVFGGNRGDIYMERIAHINLYSLAGDYIRLTRLPCHFVGNRYAFCLWSKYNIKFGELLK